MSINYKINKKTSWNKFETNFNYQVTFLDFISKNMISIQGLFWKCIQREKERRKIIRAHLKRIRMVMEKDQAWSYEVYHFVWSYNPMKHDESNYDVSRIRENASDFIYL